MVESLNERRNQLKPKYHWQIIGYYNGNREVIDYAKDAQEALYLKSEYQLAFGIEWSIGVKKMKGEME